MPLIIPTTSRPLPIAASGTLIAAAGECAQERFIESGFRSCLSAFGRRRRKQHRASSANET